MDKRAAQILAVNMMHEHGLRGWKFDWMNKKRRIAECYCGPRIIMFSTVFVPTMSEDDVRQTMLHEIAHALTPGHGHDRVWKAKARSLGYRGEAINSEAVPAITALYTATCPSGHTAHRHRMSDAMRPGRTFCRSCYKRGIQHAFVWKHTATGQPVFPAATSAHPAVAAAAQRQTVRRASPRKPSAYNGRGAFDKGFTDIESLFG